MKPDILSQRLLAITRSKAKMYEYQIPLKDHIKIERNPLELLNLSIGLLGDLSANVNRGIQNVTEINEQSNILQFSAHFFDAYLRSHLNQDLDPYTILLSAASYYLCGLPGSSSVLAKNLGDKCPDLECSGLEDLLLWLLQGDLSTYFKGMTDIYGALIDVISEKLIVYFAEGIGLEDLRKSLSDLRKLAYYNGTSRQLLMADIIVAVAEKRIVNSTWNCLPKYSNIDVEHWRSILQKETFVHELWPAQHMLGEHGIFQGKSAIVQMPTSAGKSKATEIIIRSAFLANRTSLAIIVAPFRALCHEIRNSLVKSFHDESVTVDELSDVLQTDFVVSELTDREVILVVTPEKLIYVLRHAPELARSIGLIIYDEGHQFDSGLRGVTYELLLTSLKLMLPEGVQTVLISAVISNADSIGKWLNGKEPEVISSTTLNLTYRSVAFASWLDRLGRLEFVSQDRPDISEFFVPRVLEQVSLQRKKNERKERFFPDKTDGQSIALFLALKVVVNGSVAIFCGRKATASSLSEKIVDTYNRGVEIKKPLEYSDQSEMERLFHLYELNLGIDATSTQSAALGIISHHGDIPHGIRLAVEYALKEGLARFVICTSTLAQGVNLPIRYLIVSSVYQGAERIKVRDFHNLLGRAGRAGMHTEGSIIFADPIIYDKRKARDDRWRWSQIKQLLDPKNSEHCTSSLLSLFEPLKSDDDKYEIIMEPLELVRRYNNNAVDLMSFLQTIAAEHADEGFSVRGIEKQISWKLSIISSIESFLMSHWDDINHEPQEGDISGLAKGTLAFFLSDKEQQSQITELFDMLAQNIKQKVTEPSKRKIFGKTLYGVQTSIDIENWLNENINELYSCKDSDDLLETLWPVIARNTRNSIFVNCDKPEALIAVAKGWILGQPFHELHSILSSYEARIVAGKMHRQFKVDHIVNLCENAFAFDSTLVAGAVAELVNLMESEYSGRLIKELRHFQKKLKYGLPSKIAIILYELGFADRIVTMDLLSIIDKRSTNKITILRQIKQNEAEVRKKLYKYPTYFTERLNDLL